MSSTEFFATTSAKLESGAGVALSDALSSKEGKGEKVKMKINEVIQEMDNETILNIGSGSGWFFIGKKEDYEKNIEKISRSYLNNAKEREKKYRERIREANEVLADSKLTFDELEKMVKKIRRNFPALKLVEKYINEFIPIKKREVKNIYDKDKKEDGICIVVEGTENGKFWDREEWERENGKIE